MNKREEEKLKNSRNVWKRVARTKAMSTFEEEYKGLSVHLRD